MVKNYLTRQLRKASKNKVLTNFPSFPPQSLRCRRVSAGGHTTRSVQCPSGGIKRVVTLMVIKDSSRRPGAPTPVKNWETQ